MQTLARVANEPNPWAYEFTVDEKYVSKNNTLPLDATDWAFFVLYNRGKLEDVRGTEFYEHYAHLADGKDFIIGPIADDIYGRCLDDFCDGRITDWTFRQIITCFDYGLQIVAKSQRACDCLEMVGRRVLSKEECKEILSHKTMNQKERQENYGQKVAELNQHRKGLYIQEIFKEAREKSFPKKEIDQDADRGEFHNLQFPDNMIEADDIKRD